MTWYSKQGSKRIAMVALLVGAALLVPGLTAATAPQGATQTTLNATGNTYFGRATDVEGNRMIAGDASAAKAYIYVRDASGWQLEATLSGASNFGDAVAISGDVAAVASTGGLVQTFTRSGNTWTQAPGGCFCGVSSGGSGTPIDIVGNVIAMGGGSQIFVYNLVNGQITSPVAGSPLFSANQYRVFLSGNQLLYTTSSCQIRVYNITASGLLFKNGLSCYGLAAVAGDYALATGSGSLTVLKRDAGGDWKVSGTIAPPSGRYFDWNPGVSEEGVVAASLNQPPIAGSMLVYRPTAAGYVLMDAIDGTWNYGQPTFSGADLIDWGCTYNPTACGVQVFHFDADGDDLAKWTELRIGTDWMKYDTDGDLWSDGQEYRCAANPLDQLAFPTPACEGTLPGGLRAEPLAGAQVDAAWATFRGTYGPQDLDGDNLPDLAESRVCGTAAATLVLTSAGGAAGSCASGTNYVAPASSDAQGAVHGAFKAADAHLAEADLSPAQGQGLPTYANAWTIPCLVEDAGSAADGFCTGAGGYQRYHLPPVLP